MLGELLEGKPHEQFLWGGAGNGRSISAPRQSLTRQTDVRSLKRTVHLHHITAKSEDMMEKELLMAMAAYNLVRAVMCLAAQQHGLSARQLSFAPVLNVVQAAWPKLVAARNQQEHHREFQRVLDFAAQCTLPRRAQRRSYPRAVWRKPRKFPFYTMEKSK